jgi:hypothetical protein
MSLASLRLHSLRGEKWTPITPTADGFESGNQERKKLIEVAAI